MLLVAVSVAQEETIADVLLEEALAVVAADH